MRRLIYTSFILLLVLPLTYCQLQKFRLDREVSRLCAIDGGKHIFETVKLSAEDFGPDGRPFPQYRGAPSSNGGLGPDYFSTLTAKTLVDGYMSLTRYESAIVRKADDKVLGIGVTYGRRGGGLVPLAPEAVYVCPEPSTPGLEELIFKHPEK